MPNSPDALARLRAAFTAPEPPAPGQNPGTSAVLLALYDTPAGLSLLYTKRSESLSSHPGQVSFPGGRMDPGDADALAAALREAEEEVGILPSDVDVLGHVADMTTFYGAFVRAFAGHVREPPPSAPRSTDEVELVFLKPIAELLDASGYEGRAMPEGARAGRAVHYFRGKHPTIWGLTGEITARFLARAYAWEAPRKPRVVHDVAGFMP